MTSKKGERMTVSEQLLSDTTLLKRIETGDTLSFETLFYRYYDKVYGLLFRLLGNRVEAEDLTQEVFLKLYQKPPRNAGIQHNIGGWLYRVATNKGYNYIRGRKRLWERNRWLVPGADRTLKDESSADPSLVMEQNEAQNKVRYTLSQLKPREGQLLILRQMGFSYAELAEACEVAPGSVGTLLARAVIAFRKAY